MKTSVTYSDIIRLALPIYGGLLATTLVGIVDTAFLGEVDLAQQSAAGYGALFHLVFYVIGMGFTLGTQILIARRIGEGKQSLVGLIFWNGIFFMLLYALLVFIFFNTGIHHFFDFITHSENISRLTADYLQARSFGLFGTMINLCFIAFYVGKGDSLAISVSSVLSGIVNIVLAYIFIFRLPQYAGREIIAAAAANGISDLSGTLVFIIFTLLHRGLGAYQLRRSLRFSAAQWKITFRVSLPLMAQNMISIAAWFVFFTLIEKTGTENFGISIIVRQVYAVFMMSPIALGSATNSLVSNLIGQRRQEEVMPLIYKVGIFSLVFMLITALPLALVPEPIFMLFTADTALAKASLPTIYVITATLAIFAVSNVFYQSVSGTGKTTVALVIEISTIALYLLYSFGASYAVPHRLHIIWLAETLYMLVFGVVSYFYMRSGRWKNVQI